MQKINNAKIIGGLLFFACLVQASYSGSVSSSTPTPELKCYVCQNCAKITKQTPLEECDAEFFEKHSSTEEPDTDDSTTNTPLMTTTETTTENTSTEMSTETTTTTLGSTTVAVPTAPTVGPINTTTTVTPLNEGTVPTSVFEMRKTNTTESTTNTTSGDVPQAMPLIAEDYSYHCYSVQKNMNGSVSVERGCSRVTTMESVCGQLKSMNMGVQLTKCAPCSNSECNGSNALGVSMAALVFALIAALLSRH